MSKTFEVGDEVTLDLDYLLIVKRGKVEGLSLKPSEYGKTSTIRSIDLHDKYPYKLTSKLSGTSRFAKEEIIKVQP